MTLRYKDYYQLLEVARSASDDQIRQAYRKMARKYHPDFNPGDTVAEDNFKDINEAYEVLSDPDRRKQYDGLGPGWKNGSDFTPPSDWGRRRRPPPPRASPQARSAFSEFFEALFGGGRERRQPAASRKEPKENVHSVVTISLEAAHKGGVRTIALKAHRACQVCKGKGLAGGRICAPCGGLGKLLSTRTVDVKLPPGARDGAVIKLAGQGPRAASSGVRGDLLIKLRIEPHSFFTVDGDDLHGEMPIAPWEAVLGATIEVPTLDGKAEIRIPPNSQAGQKFRLRSQGLSKREGGRGDAYLSLKVVVPENPTEREMKLYRELADASPSSPRRESS